MTPPEPPAVFEEPWQAQAFALTLHLHAAGAFTWSQWTDALSKALKSTPHPGQGPDAPGDYAAWLLALETLTVDLGLTDTLALAKLKADWAEAYAHTPHGHPVTLRGGVGGSVSTVGDGVQPGLSPAAPRDRDPF